MDQIPDQGLHASSVDSHQGDEALHPEAPTIDRILALPPLHRRTAVAAESARRKAGLQLDCYRPYPRQREFHTAGGTHRERLLLAANQVGKTLAAGQELAMHLTGQYPSWWDGHRLPRANHWWAAGVTGEATRDNVQRILLGRGGQYGTGTLPAATLHHVSTGRGVAGLADVITVRHAGGGLSSVALKSYEQGRERFQGETLDGIWLDEEPPEKIHSEALTRTNASGGILMITFTPLLGMSPVVKRFLLDKPPGTHVTRITIEDAAHYTEEARQRIRAAYPTHEAEARTRGVPTMGEGRVFPVLEEAIVVPAFAIPGHWPQIGGLDFGWDHPFAAVSLAWDRDQDIVYVTRCHRQRHATPILHAAALRAWGEWLPWAWPHDGLAHDKGSGLPLASQYRTAGLRMLPDHTRHADGGISVEAGIMDLLDRMQTGRFRCFGHLSEWLEEFRHYHRRDGRIVKEGDDLLAATRYALMSLRHACPPPPPARGVHGGDRMAPTHRQRPASPGHTSMSA